VTGAQTHTHTCIYIYMCVCVYIYIYMYTYIYVYMYIIIYIYVYTYIHINLYYINIYIYIYIYISVYINRLDPLLLGVFGGSTSARSHADAHRPSDPWTQRGATSGSAPCGSTKAFRWRPGDPPVTSESSKNGWRSWVDNGISGEYGMFFSNYLDMGMIF